MKIIITEKQFKKLMESIESLGDPSPNTTKEYPGNDVMTTAPITNKDGEVENGDNDFDFAKNLSPQSPFSHGRSMVSRQG